MRAPLAHVANQVFLDLANELEAQGVSRKVSADMFGMALRAYVRKVQRLGGDWCAASNRPATPTCHDAFALLERTTYSATKVKIDPVTNHPAACPID